MNRIGFRQGAQAWLALGERHPPRVLDSPRFDDRVTVAEPLLVRGDFVCGADCRFLSPVYVQGRAEAGRGSRLRALTAEGAIALLPGASVEQWAESADVLHLRAGAVVEGEAVAARALLLALDASAGSLHAPEIATHGRVDGLPPSPPPGRCLELPPPRSGTFPDFSAIPGWRPGNLRPLDPDTWACDGSLHLPAPLLSTARLIVRGSLWCPPGSLIEGDLKAGGWIEIGASSLCRGAISAADDITLHEACLFSGDLQSGGVLRLYPGVRGFRGPGGVSVRAASVILETDVSVRGTISGRTRVVRPAPAQDWLRQAGFSA